MSAAAEPPTSPTPNAVRRWRAATWSPENMTEITVEASEGLRWVVYFSLAGDRFHIFFNPTTKAVSGETLFRNPPGNMRSDEEGFFHTRYLKASAKKNAPLIERLFAVIERDGLIAIARADLAATREQQRLERIEYGRNQVKADHGPKLYAALRELLRCPDILDHWAGPALALLNAVDAEAAKEVARIEAQG